VGVDVVTGRKRVPEPAKGKRHFLIMTRLILYA